MAKKMEKNSELELKQPWIRTDKGEVDIKTGEFKDYSKPLKIISKDSKSKRVRVRREVYREHDMCDLTQRDVGNINKIVARFTTKDDVNRRIPKAIMSSYEQVKEQYRSGDFTNVEPIESAIPTANALRREYDKIWSSLSAEEKAKFPTMNAFYKSVANLKDKKPPVPEDKTKTDPKDEKKSVTDSTKTDSKTE